MRDDLGCQGESRDSHSYENMQGDDEDCVSKWFWRTNLKQILDVTQIQTEMQSTEREKENVHSDFIFWSAWQTFWISLHCHDLLLQNLKACHIYFFSSPISLSVQILRKDVPGLVFDCSSKAWVASAGYNVLLFCKMFSISFFSFRWTDCRKTAMASPGKESIPHRR